MNLIYVFFEIIILFFLIIYFYKKNNLDGLEAFIIIFSTVCFIVSPKMIELLGFNINLGFVIVSVLLIVGNIIAQKKGPEGFNKIVIHNLVCNFIVFLSLILISNLDNSNFDIITNKSFNNMFLINYRISFISIISLNSILFINSRIYHIMRQIKNKIWISNILSTIIINFIECILFCFLSYVGNFSIFNIIELIVIRYIFKIFISLLGTSTIYYICKSERKIKL